jgi:hypothetical protein
MYSFKGNFFVLFVKIFSPYLEITVSSLCIEVFSASFKSANITWSSAGKVSQCLYILKVLFLLSHLFRFRKNMIYVCVKVKPFLLIFVLLQKRIKMKLKHTKIEDINVM